MSAAAIRRRPSVRKLRRLTLHAALVLLLGALASILPAQHATAATTSSTLLVVEHGAWYFQESALSLDTLDISGTASYCEMVLVNDDGLDNIGPGNCRPAHIQGSVQLGSGCGVTVGTTFRCASGSLSMSLSYDEWCPGCGEPTYPHVTIDLKGLYTKTTGPVPHSALNLTATDATFVNNAEVTGPATVEGSLEGTCPAVLVPPYSCEGNKFALFLGASGYWH